MLSVFTYQTGYWSVWALFSAMIHEGMYRHQYLFTERHLQICKYVSWMMLSSSSIGGLYITFYHPKHLYLPHVRIELSGISLITCDVMGHHIPWYLFTKKHIQQSIPMSLPLVLAICIFSLLGILYYTMFDWRTRYGLSSVDVRALVTIFACLNCLIRYRTKWI